MRRVNFRRAKRNTELLDAELLVDYHYGGGEGDGEDESNGDGNAATAAASAASAKGVAEKAEAGQSTESMDDIYEGEQHFTLEAAQTAGAALGNIFKQKSKHQMQESKAAEAAKKVAVAERTDDWARAVTEANSAPEVASIFSDDA